MVILARKGTKILLSRGIIKESQVRLYEYGFELLFSTVITVLFILLIGILWDELSRTMIFLLFFIPIRITAGGYHAKTYSRCFIVTNLIAMLCVWGSRLLYDMSFSFGFSWVIFCGTCVYIWKNAPIIPAQYRERTRREDINRKYSRNVLKIEIIMVLFLSLVKSALMYTAISTSCIVALMMAIVRGGEKYGFFLGKSGRDD